MIMFTLSTHAMRADGKPQAVAAELSYTALAQRFTADEITALMRGFAVVSTHETTSFTHRVTGAHLRQRDSDVRARRDPHRGWLGVPGVMEAIIVAARHYARRKRVFLRCQPFMGALAVTDLCARTPGRGHGAAAMGFLLRQTDRAGLDVLLRPACPDSARFYARLGFAAVDYPFGFMRRPAAARG